MADARDGRGRRESTARIRPLSGGWRELARTAGRAATHEEALHVDAAAYALDYKVSVAEGYRRLSLQHDQLDALRSLAGLMEALRSRLTGAFAHKDESDLFEVANRFNIRHAGGKQQGNYDRSIFLPWIFYSHVAAIHAAFRLIQRSDGEG